jgi:Na+-translocating ferredoxin:NAD+ oxidoreductase RnfC subunit
MDLLDKVKEAGVIGAGGAGFPTHVKLQAKAEYILINGAECEPLLRLHRQLLKFHAPVIIEAFEKTREVLGAKEAIVCIKDHYKGAIEAVTALLPKYPKLRIKILPIVYPAGDEIVMIYEATGKVVRPGGLPIEQGVAVFNVETMYNAYYALKGEPLTSKLVTIAGEVKNPMTVRVPLGVTLKELVEYAGGETIDDYVYWTGGPMMGFIDSPNSPVTKTTNSVFVLPSDHYLIRRTRSDYKVETARAAASCCQCKMCTDLCPRNNLGHPIEPHKIMLSASCGNFKDINSYLNTFYCSSCGVCEMYACPQGLSPRKLIQTVKMALRASGVTPPSDVKASSVSPIREYRKIPLDRLVSRLGVKKYQTNAPLNNELIDEFSTVNILTSQHIGAPAKPIVKFGDFVEKGQVIAEAVDGLSVNIHASISGLVIGVDDKSIMIKKKD